MQYARSETGGACVVTARRFLSILARSINTQALVRERPCGIVKRTAIHNALLSSHARTKSEGGLAVCLFAFSRAADSGATEAILV